MGGGHEHHALHEGQGPDVDQLAQELLLLVVEIELLDGRSQSLPEQLLGVQRDAHHLDQEAALAVSDEHHAA